MGEKFNIIKKGYDPAEVDEYVGMLETVVNSYKEKDAAIKNAIINAQIAADNIIGSARNEASEIKAESIRSVERLLEEVSACKEHITSFKCEYDAMIQKYATSFDENDATRLFSGADGIETYIAGAKASLSGKDV